MTELTPEQATERIMLLRDETAKDNAKKAAELHIKVRMDKARKIEIYNEGKECD
jgi:hypothetical protein